MLTLKTDYMRNQMCTRKENTDLRRQSGKTIGGDSPASLQSADHRKAHQQQTTGHRAAGEFTKFSIFYHTAEYMSNAHHRMPNISQMRYHSVSKMCQLCVIQWRLCVKNATAIPVRVLFTPKIVNAASTKGTVACEKSSSIPTEDGMLEEFSKSAFLHISISSLNFLI